MTKDQIDKELKNIWICKLFSDFRNCNKKVNRHLKNDLEAPIIKIIGGMSKWGEWDPQNRIISLNDRLFKSFSWESIRYVFRHELAHAIVSEVFNMGDLKAHGEAFNKACNVLGIYSHSCDSSDFLKSLEDENKKKVVEKVKKLMALNSSSNKHESKIALSKAHDLMLKHNIKELDNSFEEEYYARPIGEMYGRFPTYGNVLCDIVKDFYFVIPIIQRVNVKEKNRFKEKRFIEIFGKKENMDIAEYVVHFLLAHGKREWEYFKKNNENIKGRYSKSSFLNGYFDGFYKKLSEDKNNKTKDVNGNELIWNGDSLMQEMHKKTYPNLVNISTPLPRSGGFSEGSQLGKKLKLNSGINESVNRKKQLN